MAFAPAAALASGFPSPRAPPPPTLTPKARPVLPGTLAPPGTAFIRAPGHPSQSFHR
jgi:hypothetical protein